MRLGLPLSILAAAASAGLGLACANGNPSLSFVDGTDGTGDSEDSGPGTGLPPSGGDAAAPPGMDTPDAAATGDDAATAVDAGKDAAVVDSGTTMPPPGAGDCVGTQSAQLSSSYDDACDNYFFNVGASNPCTVGGSSCAALDSATLTFCCYKPPSGSNCSLDYAGQPQCIPK
jgi:hypothetical protein